MTIDPRGPVRTITKVTETPSETLLTKDCGHTSGYNPTSSYKVGGNVRCTMCRDAGRAVDRRQTSEAFAEADADTLRPKKTTDFWPAGRKKEAAAYNRRYCPEGK